MPAGQPQGPRPACGSRDLLEGSAGTGGSPRVMRCTQSMRGAGGVRGWLHRGWASRQTPSHQCSPDMRSPPLGTQAQPFPSHAPSQPPLGVLQLQRCFPQEWVQLSRGSHSP